MSMALGVKEKQYKLNKDTKVGCYIKCPICGNEVIKTNYAQAFCSNECKVEYWNKKGDRHKKGYYRKYNKAHPQRLERGFTKGYINGNVSEGKKPKQNGGYVFDALGRAYSRDFYNPTMTQMINERLSMWHDDDWEEGAWGE
jgi:hypothetical protein